jgi:Beta-lactamase
MAPRFDGVLSRCEKDILEILRIAGTQLCTVYLEMQKMFPQQETYSDGKPCDNSDDTVFPWCSLSKIVVAETLAIIINDLATSSDPENARFEPLRDAWEKPFLECFNDVSENKMLDLPGNPKIQELVVHYAGIPPLNHIIMAPDGTPLTSSDDFLTVARHLTKDTYGDLESHDRWKYSNGNTILIGLLIEAAAGRPLPEVVNKLVFEKLEMHSAYMGTQPDNPNVAIPHIVSAEGATPIDPPQTLSDPLCIAAMGVHSNTKDIATFFRSIVLALPDGPGETKAMRMAYLSKLWADTGYGEYCYYFPCGMLTYLDTTVPGAQSLNRWVSPDSESSNYILGYEPPEKNILVFYHGGTVNGFECCSYIIPKWRAFLIVQANTTGHVDATDHISRLILQSLFSLKPIHSECVDIPRMAEKGAKERAEFISELTKLESIPDNVTAIPSSHLVGTYTHERYRQAILISEREGKLWARWRGSQKADGQPTLSSEMQLLRVDERIVRLKVMHIQPNIDRFDAWRDLDFAVLRHGDQPVASLSRQDPNRKDHFITFHRSLESLPDIPRLHLDELFNMSLPAEYLGL